MKVILVTADPTISPIQISRLSELVSSTVKVLNRNKINSQATITLLKDIDILVGGSSGFGYLNNDILEKLPNLKMISILGVGTDWIDLKSAKRLNIVISNAKGANAESVAEHIWGIILGLSKKIVEADRNVSLKGEYKFINYLGNEVYGKTLGIIGLGEIGKRVARIAKGFNMQIIGSNKGKEKVDGVELVDLVEIYKKSDIIAICVPLTNETKGMVSNSEIKIMKKGVLITSTSREDIVDQSAVIEGLKSGNIGGYGFDADIMRKIKKNSEFHKFPNVIITPHTAFYTKEADSKTYDVCIDNVEAYLKGKPINVVN